MDVSLKLVNILDEKINSAEICSFVSVINGTIDHKKMLFSLQKILETYPVLKTRCAPLEELPLNFLSMNFQSHGHFKNFIADYADIQRKVLSQKNSGPLFDCSIIKYDFQAYLFFLTIERSIYDVCPDQLFFGELLKFYDEHRDYAV